MWIRSPRAHKNGLDVGMVGQVLCQALFDLRFVYPRELKVVPKKRSGIEEAMHVERDPYRWTVSEINCSTSGNGFGWKMYTDRIGRCVYLPLMCELADTGSPPFRLAWCRSRAIAYNSRRTVQSLPPLKLTAMLSSLPRKEEDLHAVT